MASTRNDLSDYVKRVMKLKGLTQKDVQRMSGWKITDGYVASITTARATNLSVDKLLALADGLGVDYDELFHIASGAGKATDARTRSAPDSMIILETVQQVVMSPVVTQILHEVVGLSSDERAVVLEYVKKLGSGRRKSRRKARSD